MPSWSKQPDVGDSLALLAAWQWWLRWAVFAFVAAVGSGQAPKPDGEDGLKALLLADAATRSAQTGQVVRL